MGSVFSDALRAATRGHLNLRAGVGDVATRFDASIPIDKLVIANSMQPNSPQEAVGR